MTAAAAVAAPLVPAVLVQDCSKPAVLLLPDRNPATAEVMRDLNELWQAPK